MGASVWLYVTPYQPDISKALQELRDQIFAEGKYYVFEYWDELEEDPPPPPESIEELMRRNGTEWTHSILDVATVLDRPVTREEWTSPDGEYSEMTLIVEKEGYGVVSPLSDENLLHLFGTTRPQKRQLRDLIIKISQPKWVPNPIDELTPGWGHGIYFVTYEGDTPAEIFFYGYSGD